MLGGIDKANAMARIGEKGSTRLHAGEMTAFAFDAQFLLDATLRSHQAHQCFGLMSVELISDKDPRGLRVGLDGLGDVGGEVGFGARRSKAGRDDLSGRYIQISDQRLGAMALVLEFLACDMTGLHRQRGMETLQSLDAGHLICTGHMRARRSQSGGCFIDLAHRADLLGEFGGVIGRWGEPIPLAMRLQSAHLLKNVPPCGEKSARQCRV